MSKKGCECASKHKYPAIMDEATKNLVRASLVCLGKSLHGMAKDKGFWPKEKKKRNVGELLALVHAELSECLEATREAKPMPDHHVPEFENRVVELADAVIRIFDMAEGLGWPLVDALIAKARYNATRPHKHGKRF